MLAYLHFVMPAPTFYKTCLDETCVSGIRPMFQTLGCNDSVTASISCRGDSGLSHSRLLGIHNHLDSSSTWKKKEQWVTEVEYTIPHPDGDVKAFDTKSERSATLKSTTQISKKIGHTDDNLWDVTLTRTSAVNYRKMDLNTQRFSRVKIMNTKRFLYETGRSSWIFRLVVAWEGLSKEDAKKSQPKYFVYIETNDNIKASVDPTYSAASLLEKVLDIVSHGKTRSSLIFE